MAPKTFGDLSDDLKTSVIQQINRPSDLKNVCLASKACHDIAVRSLYHTICLDVGGPSDSKVTALLNPNNKGLRHIRVVSLYLAKTRHHCGVEQQAQLITRMMLESIPENVLREFSWCPWTKFSADNLLLLYRKQKRLTWLEAMTLDTNVLPYLEAKPAEYEALFKNCKKLAFYPETRDTLDLCHSFLVKVPAVEELILHTNFDSARPSLPARELNDAAQQPGLVTRTIFSHMLPFDTCTSLQNLTSLRLHHVHLRHCAETYCRVIDFSKLTSLRIYNCTGTDALLSELCKSTSLPRKLEVLELQHKDNAENDTLVALDGLLCLVSGLEELVLDLDNVKALPAVAGVARHGKTLHVLNVHCADPDSPVPADCEELVYSTEDFEKICSSATGLEQLCCAFPDTRILSPPGRAWTSFARAAASMPDLVTLNITTWPGHNSSENLVTRSVYVHLLQGFAQRLFEMASGSNALVPESGRSSPSSVSSLPLLPLLPLSSNLSNLNLTNPTTDTPSQPQTRPSSLRLVAFGSSDKIFERRNSNSVAIFYRSKQVTWEEKEAVHAVPISWCQRQYVEERSDVLDFSLARQQGMPVPNGYTGDDSD